MAGKKKMFEHFYNQIGAELNAWEITHTSTSEICNCTSAMHAICPNMFFPCKRIIKGENMFWKHIGDIYY